jgi:hypothetical protein
MGSGLPGGVGQIVGTVVVGLLVMGLLVRRNLRPRQLKIERLWIRPLLFALITGTTVGASPVPFDAVSLSVFVLALGLGAALGWQRGRFMHILVDPETHDLTVRASPVGIVLIVGLLGLKVLLRGARLDSHSLFGVPAAALTDGVVFLLGATVVAQSLEMWLRARRLLAEAQAARAAATSPSLGPSIVS